MSDSVSAELVSVDKVAALLDCCERHVYRLADSGRMPKPIKLGASTKWKLSEIREWIANNCPRVASRGAK
ncbi:MAG: helix-turn-helix domain-containing protein [Pirellulales bacterium]